MLYVLTLFLFIAQTCYSDVIRIALMGDENLKDELLGDGIIENNLAESFSEYYNISFLNYVRGNRPMDLTSVINSQVSTLLSSTERIDACVLLWEPILLNYNQNDDTRVISGSYRRDIEFLLQRMVGADIQLYILGPENSFVDATSLIPSDSVLDSPAPSPSIRKSYVTYLRPVLSDSVVDNWFSDMFTSAFKSGYVNVRYMLTSIVDLISCNVFTCHQRLSGRPTVGVRLLSSDTEGIIQHSSVQYVTSGRRLDDSKALVLEQFASAISRRLKKAKSEMDDEVHNEIRRKWVS